MTRRWRVDLHTHTNHSWDGWMTPARLVQCARHAGLDRIAVTDHNEIDGALRARDLAPELIIVGEEVLCREGVEIIGLFLTSRIPPRLPLSEVVARIHDQGGLVYAPHPYAYLTATASRARRLLSVADIVEVFNGRAFWPPWNAQAATVARARGLPAAASSDAHLPIDCGRAWTELEPFRSPAELLAACADATIVRRSTATPALHAVTLANGLARAAMQRLRYHAP